MNAFTTKGLLQAITLVGKRVTYMWIGYMNIFLINFDVLVRLLRRHRLKGNLHHILSSIGCPDSLNNLNCLAEATTFTS